MASLAATFGRGAMTNGWTDIENADVVLVMGGNPAENHPVGFRFAMAAKQARKAVLVCVDPRFNRTAAVSDCYVQIRAGTDIAFLGGLIHYALSRGLWQQDYVRRHTNAAFVVADGFAFQDGLFSGWDAANKRYDKSTWRYELDAEGYAVQDQSLQHERCVFQLLQRHYARYTPDQVAAICGCSAADFERAAAIVCSTGTPDRVGTVMYALGWTHHSHAVQLIRTAAILQLLLGNIGVPGGGVNAQRGHANIQGATDLGAWDKLPGYLAVPSAQQVSLAKSLEDHTPRALARNAMNYWANTPKFMVSLLKACYGSSAAADNEFGYQNLPKREPGRDYSWGTMFDEMYRGRLEGLLCFGMNPVANGPNSAKMIKALGKLKWMIVAECFETETAAFWDAKRLAAKYYADASDPAAVATEVLLLPAACFAEKDGAFVNSSRWLQWKEAALDPPGEARRDQEIVGRLFGALRDLYRKDGGTAPGPLLDMAWDYSNPTSPSLVEVAKELNGREVASRRQLSGFGELKDDGSTACGNWLYAGSFTEAGNMMARRGQEDPSGLGMYHDYSWNWPANRRVLYNVAGTDAAGRPWDRSRAGLVWDSQRWRGDVPDTKADAPPGTFGAFVMLPEGVAKLFATDLAEGPFPEHYEPVESPVENALHPQVSSNPAAVIFTSDLDRLGTAAEFPYVALTYRLTEHFHYWTKHTSAGAQLQPRFFVELPQALADEKGIRSGDMVRVRSARGHVDGQALVTRRLRPLAVNGRTVYQVGLPIHWGFVGKVTGPLVNNLSPAVVDPNSGTPEYKGFLVDVQKVEKA